MSREYPEHARGYPERTFTDPGLHWESERRSGVSLSAPLRSLRSQEDTITMESPRWLFPFTHGVDMRAIDTVVRFAEERGATLVAVSLIAVPTERRSHGARLEHIQQSTDFLEAVKFKAAAHQVSIERYETFTGNVPGSITLLTHDQRCDRIVLVSSEEKDVLLHAHEKKRLLEDLPVTLVFLRLPTQKQRTGRIHTRFLPWLRRHWEQQNDTSRGKLRSAWVSYPGAGRKSIAGDDPLLV